MRDVLSLSKMLLKILIPALVVVRLLTVFGFSDYLGMFLSPVMTVTGLPSAMGIVWATTLLASVPAGIAVFFQVAATESITVAQVSVLGLMMLIGHALPTETRIAQLAGLRAGFVVALRIGGAIIAGALLNQIYLVGNLLQEPLVLSGSFAVVEESWLGWIQAQISSLAYLLLIMSALLLGMKLLKAAGIEAIMVRALAPLMSRLGICRSASSITIVGLLLGITYGGGLLVREANSGNIGKKDIILAMVLLNLCHSVIEDSLLLIVMGADLSAVLFARVVFTVVSVKAFSFLLGRIDNKTTDKYIGAMTT